MKKGIKDRYEEKVPVGDEPMYQYFGDSPSSLKIKRPPSIQKPEIGESLAKVLDKPQRKTGFFVLIGVLAVILVVFVLNKNFADAFGSALFIGLIFYVVRKATVLFNEEAIRKMSNVSLVIKELLVQFAVSRKLLMNARAILALSVLLMIVETWLLRWFLPAFISSTLYSVGFYGMCLGVFLSFANQKPLEAYRGLLITYAYFIISILSTGLFANDLYYFSLITCVLVWVLAGWMRQFGNPVSTQAENP